MAVGYRTCKKNCACYTQRVSKSIKKLKQEYSEEKKDNIKKKRTATVLEKYGVENVMQLADVQTKNQLNRDYVASSIKNKETKQENHGDPGYNNTANRITTNLDKYGQDRTVVDIFLK